MNMISIHRTVTTAAAAAFVLATPAVAQGKLGVTDPAAYLLDEAEEIELSRSAAPASISADATVLVLSADGSYRTASEGTNGWTCFTGRSWTGPAPIKDGRRVWNEAHFDPELRAPQCFNAAATPSLLMLHRLTTWKFMQGASTEEVDNEVGQALAGGKIQPPGMGAMSYMYSPRQVLTPGGGRFMPHVMLYTPYVTQDAFGPHDSSMTVPMVTEGGSVFATTVIVSSKWSDGSPAMGH